MPYEFERSQNFVEIIKLVLNAEGGYVNDPADPGGPTKYGIAYNYNREILREMKIEDVRNLTYEQAKQIYYVKYWLPAGCEKIPDKKLQYIHFDAAVNQGVGQALAFLGRLSKAPGAYEGNGKNEALWFRLFLEYVAMRQRHYARLGNRKRFFEGWINRMSSVMEHALRF